MIDKDEMDKIANHDKFLREQGKIDMKEFEKRKNELLDILYDIDETFIAECYKIVKKFSKKNRK